MKKNNIILLATYWNEADWIEASLAQIEKINPREAIICDGNFDPSVENYSTDGTREIINRFIRETHVPCQMISAIRCSSKWLKGWDMFHGAGCVQDGQTPISRLFPALRAQFRQNIYRINQAITFAHMCRLSNLWSVGGWVMSYDADQFYCDDLIDAFTLTADLRFDYDLITADEYTFPYDFNNFTREYELRKWNNMPHRIKSSMAVYPTRHFMVEGAVLAQNYQDNFKRFHAGIYHHYKFREDKSRIVAGYSLGDRKPPEAYRYSKLESADSIDMPSIIKDKFRL
jgi:hypothetical protein